MVQHRFSVTPTSTLSAVFDLEARVARATREDTLKGMFFKRVVDLATRSGVAVESVGLKHRQPGNRYSAFGDYPVADYFRWVAAVGQALHPRASISEAMRRVGRQDFSEFASSRIGSVMLAFTGNAKSTLSASGSLYSQVLKGSATVESEATSEGVIIRYRNYPGPVEFYPIGTIESTCHHYGADYSIDVVVMNPLNADYHVRIFA